MAEKQKSRYVKHSIYYWTFELLRWFSILAPFVALAIKNKDRYFKNFNGIKLTMGAFLLIGIVIWTTLRELKKKKGQNVVASSVSSIVYWGIAYALAVCFSSLLSDLQTIIFAGLMGQCLGFIFETIAEHQNELRKVYMTAEINARVSAETFGINQPTTTTRQRRKKVPYE